MTEKVQHGGWRPNSGRKPKGDGSCTAIVTIRCTEAQKEQLKDNAQKEQLSLTEFILKRCL